MCWLLCAMADEGGQLKRFLLSSVPPGAGPTRCATNGWVTHTDYSGPHRLAAIFQARNPSINILQDGVSKARPLQHLPASGARGGSAQRTLISLSGRSDSRKQIVTKK